MKQKGFTLIELVVVIVILGILSAVALPKFLNLSDKANEAALAGVSGAIASGSATNFAAKSAGTTYVALNAANVCTDALLGSLLQGGLPSGYSISGTGDCSAPATEAVSCTVSKSDYTPTATVNVVCAQ